MLPASTDGGIVGLWTRRIRHPLRQLAPQATNFKLPVVVIQFHQQAALEIIGVPRWEQCGAAHLIHGSGEHYRAPFFLTLRMLNALGPDLEDSKFNVLLPR